MTEQKRTPVRQKAKQLAKYLRQENPDYDYLRELFRHLRAELSIEVTHKDKKLPCDGAVLAAGPLAQVLDSARLSECFGTALTVDRRPNGRFSAWSR